MTTISQFHPLNPATTTLIGREATTARRSTVPRIVRPLPLWQQSLRINESRSVLERFVCLLLVLLAVAAIAYGALVTVRTFRGDNFETAVGRIAHHETR